MWFLENTLNGNCSFCLGKRKFLKRGILVSLLGNVNFSCRKREFLSRENGISLKHTDFWLESEWICAWACWRNSLQLVVKVQGSKWVN